MVRTIKLGKILALTAIFLLITGCGQGNGSGPSLSPDVGNEIDWEIGQGELSDILGNQKDLDNGVTDETIDLPHNFNDELWEKTEYAAPSGKWFLHEGEGVLGYGLTAGTVKAGAEFIVSLFGHGENGEPMNRNMRIQLTEREDFYEKKEVIVEEITFIETIVDEEIIYSNVLPGEENVSYILSAEILNDDGEVEDTLVSLIYVPTQEMNASLTTEQDANDMKASEMTVTVENYGPTNLFFGVYYTIEKKVENTWRVVPLEIAFIDIGIILHVGETYDQTVDISKLNKGKYRITKDIQADGLDLKAVLATEFTIE